MFSRGTTPSEYSLNGGDNDHVSLSLGVCVMPFPILNLITLIHLTQVLQEMGCVCESWTWIT